MVTAEEIAQIALFASLDPAHCERLSRIAADISLAPGEYAADQGSERALFALLSGKIEPVQHVDGIARAVGIRHPGDIFGEVPIVLGTVFPVGFRAAESSPAACPGRSGWSEPDVRQRPERPSRRSMLRSRRDKLSNSAASLSFPERSRKSPPTRRA
jgi:hypothetical protein